ncbi:MAG: DinB family protein [Phycisphaerales bacterium]|nr:DinB family protein [Phycisphaerales bacterium]
MPTSFQGSERYASLAALSPSSLVERFRVGVEHFDRRLFKMSDEMLDARPPSGAGEWTVRQLLCHLADAEVAYAHRIRRAVAEEHPVLSGWDEHAFLDLAPGMPIGGFVAVIHTMRVWMAEFLSSLDEGAWSRVMLHPDRGEESVLDVVRLATWHLEHHGEFLARKLSHLIGDVCEDPQTGCGPGCACRASE